MGRYSVAPAPAASSPAASSPAAPPSCVRMRRRGGHGETGNSHNAETLADTITRHYGHHGQPTNAGSPQAMGYLKKRGAQLRPDVLFRHLRILLAPSTVTRAIGERNS